MTTLLAKIQIHNDKEAQFEQVMAFMYTQTHDTEADVLRYEYWRGQKKGFYYCLLSFPDSISFWRHQASDHHEGEMQRFTDCIAELELETIDPVQQASPLPPTLTGQVSESESELLKEQAKLYPITEAQWWQACRSVLGKV
ncbi:MAG: quinol monooxygenase YgiN [Halioglobus sp.]|jgi:quinol monooxygenase YgiN